MFKRLLMLFVMLIIAVGCSGGKSMVNMNNDILYRKLPFGTPKVKITESQWRSVVAVQMGAKAYASGVCIGVDKEKNVSYIATAKHVVRWSKAKQQVVVYTDPFDDSPDGDGQRRFAVVGAVFHPTRDFCILTVEGVLPYYITPVRKTKGIDATVGYKGGKLKDKAVLYGKARPGQSGGAVFDNGGLHAIVSTVVSGVNILKALKDMGWEL